MIFDCWFRISEIRATKNEKKNKNFTMGFLYCVKLLATNILDFVYVFSAVLNFNMTFKYNSGRVSITLQKKKNFARRVSVTTKNRFLKHRVYFTDLAEKHQYFF